MFIFVKIFLVLPHDSVHLKHQRTGRCCIKMFKTCNRIHVPARLQGQQLSIYIIHLSPLKRIKQKKKNNFIFYLLSSYGNYSRAPCKRTLNPLKLKLVCPCYSIPPQPPVPLSFPPVSYLSCHSWSADVTKMYKTWDRETLY